MLMQSKVIFQGQKSSEIKITLFEKLKSGLNQNIVQCPFNYALKLIFKCEPGIKLLE